MKAKSSVLPFSILAKTLGLKKDILYLAYLNPSYKLIEIPKKNGDIRKVFAPVPKLKAVQRAIAAYLDKIYLPISPKNVMGFIKNSTKSNKRDIYANAKKHTKSEYLVNLDIKDFFQNSSLRMFHQILSSNEQINQDMMNIFSKICFVNNGLPAGSPCSPVISNLIFYPIDLELKKFCKSKGLNYTRYVDDLTFSSNKKISNQEIKEIQGILEHYGYQINPDKTIFYKKKDVKVVTGIAIKDNKLELCDDTLEEIEQNISYYHEWKQRVLHQYGAIPEVKDKIRKMQKSIEGQLNFVKRIEGEKGKTYKKLKSSYENSLDEKKFSFKLYI